VIEVEFARATVAEATRVQRHWVPTGSSGYGRICGEATDALLPDE